MKKLKALLLRINETSSLWPVVPWKVRSTYTFDGEQYGCSWWQWLGIVWGYQQWLVPPEHFNCRCKL